MIRRIIALFMIFALFLAALTVAGTFLILQDEPLIENYVELTHRDIARAKKLITENDPRERKAAVTQNLVITEKDLSLMLRYATKQLNNSGARINLHNGAAEIDMTIALPANFIGNFANISINLEQVGNGLQVNDAKFGSLSVPRFVIRPLSEQIHLLLAKDETYKALTNSIHRLKITENDIKVLYQWRPELVNEIKAKGIRLLISEKEKKRLLVYVQKIAELTNDPGMGKIISLNDLLSPIFSLARERSTSNPPVPENKAALLVLSFYIKGVNIVRFLEVDNSQMYKTNRHTIRLGGRSDLAKHFMISAGMAASGGSPLADSMGLFKEIDDSRGGSGFSFVDLAADRAGVRLAETAIASTKKARYVQSILSNKPTESDYMPKADDFPEFMQEAEFKQRYGGIGAVQYNKVAEQIEQRINALRIHQ